MTQMSPVAADAATSQFTVLGTVEVRSDGQRHSLGGPKQRTALAVLIAHLGRRVATDALIEAIYGADAPDGARRTVQTYVSNLRRDLGDVIKPEPDGYMLEVARDRVDATRFEDAVTAAIDQLAAEPIDAASRIRQALALWRGHPYADVDGGTALTAEITRLTDLRLVALEARIDADLLGGRHEFLVPELEALTVEHPYRERMRAQHMLALYRCGRQAEALRAYDHTRKTLVEELGIDPSPELRTLNQQILEHDERIAFGAAPPVTTKAILAVAVDVDVLGAAPPEERAAILTATDTAVIDAIATNSGTVFAQRLNTTFAHFTALIDALEASATMTREAPRIPGKRVLTCSAVDVGEVEVAEGNSLIGPVVSRATGLVAMAHPGQVLLSAAAQAQTALIGGWTIKSLGEHPVPYLDRSEGIHQLVLVGTPTGFPALRTEAHPIPLPGGMRIMPGYELREEVDRGAGWVTWRAYQPSVGREVTIKIVDPEVANNPVFVRRFELGALTVARLEHPHVVPLYDYWRDLSGAYLVSRWIDGSKLSDLPTSQSLTVDEATRFVEEIGSALASAHATGITHGGVGPDTILLDEHGAAYLADFGIDTPAATVADDIAGLAAVVAEVADLNEEHRTVVADPHSYATVGEFVAAWRATVAPGVPADERFTEVLNPYRGLSAFTFADAKNFYGRDVLIEEVIRSIDGSSLTAVVGPSGVGKSSLVQAGVVPALVNGAVTGSDEWFVITMTPGTHPFESLASALHRVATEPIPDLDQDIADGERGLLRTATRAFAEGATTLIVIDQFEEIFTLSNPEVRHAFLLSLTTAVSDPAARVRVILTLRADFFDQPLEYPEFGELLRAGTVPISAPTTAELAEIIELPAAAVGVGCAPGLVDRILLEVGTEPGRLPLLEYALTELFNRRTSDVMTIDDYETMGGVLGALSSRAESTYDSLGADAREPARQVFLRLLTLPDAERVTRRRVRMDELGRLDIAPATSDAVVDAFSQHRLLTLDRDPLTHGPTVEVAHEALFGQWRRLASWIDDRRDDLAARRRLLEATAEWESVGRDDAMLLTGARLGQTEEWMRSTDLSLTDGERSLVGASVRRRNEDAARRRGRRRAVMTGFAIAAVIASLLAVVALAQSASARREAAIAEARGLVFEAEAAVRTDPDLGIHLALAAVDTFASAGEVPSSAIDVLRTGVGAQRVLGRFPTSGGLALSRDGTVVATLTGEGAVAIHSVPSLALRATLEAPTGDAVFVGSPQDSTANEAYVVVDDGSQRDLYALDLDALVWEKMPPSPFPPRGFVEVSRDGSLVAVQADGTIEVYERNTGQSIYTTESAEDSGMAFGVGDQLAFERAGASAVDVVAVRTGQLVQSVESLPFDPEWIPLDAAGARIALAEPTGSVAVADLRTGLVKWTRRELDRAKEPTWIADGTQLAVGGESVLTVLDADAGDTLLEAAALNAWVLRPIPGGSQLVTAGNSSPVGTVLDVSLAGQPEIGALPSPLNPIETMRVNDEGTHVLVRSESAHAVLDAATGDVAFASDGLPPDVPQRATRIPISPNGAFAAGGEAVGNYRIRSVPAGVVAYEVPAGWTVLAISDDGSRAVIHRDIAIVRDGAEPPGTQLVRLPTGDVVADLDAGLSVRMANFTKDGSLVLTNNDGESAPSVLLWDAATGERVGGIGGFAGFWNEFTPDGALLISGGGEGDVYVYDVAALLDGASEDDALHLTIAAHDNVILDVGASLDGSMFFSTSWDEPGRVWDLETGDPIGEFGTSERTALAFHPTEPWLYVGEGDRITIHTLDVDDLVEIARLRLTRDMTDEECRQHLRRSCAGG